MILNIKIGDIVIKINTKNGIKRNRKWIIQSSSNIFEKWKKKPRPNNSLNIILNFEKKEKKKWKFFLILSLLFIYLLEKKRRDIFPSEIH